MATLPGKACPGCGARIPGATKGRCPDCKRAQQRARDRVKPYSYGPGWARLADVVRAAEPLCRRCAAAGKTVLGAEVHHIMRPSSEHDELFRARWNLENLCRPCHWKANRESDVDRAVRVARYKLAATYMGAYGPDGCQPNVHQVAKVWSF